MIYKGISFEFVPSKIDIIYLVLLAVVCTNIAFSLEMEALKNMSAFTSNLILNMEPIYGIALAIVIFAENEMLNTWFYAGASLIMLTVFIHPILDKYINNKEFKKRVKLLS